MKVGDLICFNAAGQKKKTLGLVIDRHIRTDNGFVHGVEIYYRIHWSKRGEVMPKEEWGTPKDKGFHKNEYYTYKKKGWFKAGAWLEIVKK